MSDASILLVSSTSTGASSRFWRLSHSLRAVADLYWLTSDTNHLDSHKDALFPKSVSPATIWIANLLERVGLIWTLNWLSKHQWQRTYHICSDKHFSIIVVMNFELLPLFSDSLEKVVVDISNLNWHEGEFYDANNKPLTSNHASLLHHFLPRVRHVITDVMPPTDMQQTFANIDFQFAFAAPTIGRASEPRLSTKDEPRRVVVLLSDTQTETDIQAFIRRVTSETTENRYYLVPNSMTNDLLKSLVNGVKGIHNIYIMPPVCEEKRIAFLASFDVALLLNNGSKSSTALDASSFYHCLFAKRPLVLQRIEVIKGAQLVNPVCLSEFGSINAAVEEACSRNGEELAYAKKAESVIADLMQCQSLADHLRPLLGVSND